MKAKSCIYNYESCSAVFKNHCLNKILPSSEVFVLSFFFSLSFFSFLYNLSHFLHLISVCLLAQIMSNMGCETDWTACEYGGCEEVSPRFG